MQDVLYAIGVGSIIYVMESTRPDSFILLEFFVDSSLIVTMNIRML